MKILVTGGTGFIGSHITKRLVAEGHEVLVTSTGSEPIIPGVKKVLYMSLEGIDWQHVHGLDAVIHQMANNDTRCQDEYEMYRANVYGPIKLVTSAFEGGCKNFVCASSTAIYGAEKAPYYEGITPVNPLTIYGKSKAAFEAFASNFAKHNKVKVTNLRYCNVYGPGEDHKGKRMSMIGQILRKMLRFQQPELFEPGDQKRDWVYVDDVVEMNMLALHRELGENKFAKTYNVGSGIAHTFNEIVETINDLLHVKMGRMIPLSPKYIPCSFAAEYQNHTECGIEKAREELKFSPRFTLRSGIDAYMRELIS